MKHLRESLVALQGREGQGLPSVRSLAQAHQVTPRTMHRALKSLESEGRIHAIDRKGFFWGRTPPPSAPLAATSRSRPEDVREKLLEDLRRGVFHPHRPLPDARTLGELHGMGARRMSLLLTDLVHNGWLVRKGRSLHVPPPTVVRSRATVAVVSRCDARGMLLLDSERETDFLKSVRIQSRELALEPLFAGWHESPSGGRLLDHQGAPLRLDHLPLPLLGILASTWLIQDPHALIAHLRPAKVPLSVWWEHPASSFPRSRSGSVAGFNLSFGASAGWEAGRHLRTMGIRTLAFVSPFHASEWSRARLDGLRQALDGTGIQVVERVDATWESAWHLRRHAQSAQEGERGLRELLESMVSTDDLARQPDWVVVNDHVAVHLIGICRERSIPRPRILSFDNTSASEAHQFDSFEFHTDGMVGQMLQRILHPNAKLFQDGGLHEMMGRLVIRERR